MKRAVEEVQTRASIETNGRLVFRLALVDQLGALWTGEALQTFALVAVFLNRDEKKRH